MEFFRPIQCYSCFAWCKHLRNECPIRYTPICSNCSETGHSYIDCEKDALCTNCQGPHPATARICPAYDEAIETLKPRIAAQLAHYIPNKSSCQLNTNTGTDIFRAAALVSNNIDEFLVSLFKACNIFTNQEATNLPNNADLNDTKLTDTLEPHSPRSQTYAHQTQDQQLQPKTVNSQTYTKMPQHKSCVQKRPIHRFCIDTSKQLMKKPRSESELLGATALTTQTVSSLRDNASDTDPDENFDISNLNWTISDDNLSLDNLSLEDYQPQITPKLITQLSHSDHDYFSNISFEDFQLYNRSGYPPQWTARKCYNFVKKSLHIYPPI